jgi:hypothetical protein
MDRFEELIKGLMGNIRSYNYVEFYHEQFNLHKQVRDIKENLKSFDVYMPKYQVQVGDWELAMNQIKVDVRERLNGFFTQTDHSFALLNYEYVTSALDNEVVAKIYKQLGPFDFYHDQGKMGNEDSSADQRSMSERFEKRRSGAIYRGEISQTTGKPEGKGIKIYPNGSIFEGFFTEG